MSQPHTREFSPSHLIGITGVIAIIVGAIVMGGGAFAFIHIPSFLFTFGVTFFLLIAIFGKDFLLFILESLLNMVSTSPEPNPKYAEIALYAGRSIIGAGLIAMIIGCVQMLQNLSDPADIGAGMAVALLSPLYAVIASEIFFAYLYKVYSSNEKPTQGGYSLKNIAVTAFGVLLTVTVFMVMMVSFANWE